MTTSATLIAHRGYSGKFPENTLIAYQTAYAYGARWMECDIQLTKDLVPIVHHDENLLRMSGVDADIRTLKAKKLKQYTAHYPDKFGNEFITNPFCTLKELSRWMKQHKDVRMFVEIKKHSIETFGIQNTMKAVYKAIKPVKGQCIIISFDPYIIDYAKQKYALSNGWVIPEWSSECQQTANEIEPDYLFSNKNIMPADTSQWWQGRWQWANYNVDEIEELPKWLATNIPFIETNEIGDIVRHLTLQESNT